MKIQEVYSGKQNAGEKGENVLADFTTQAWSGGRDLTTNYLKEIAKCAVQLMHLWNKTQTAIKKVMHKLWGALMMPASCYENVNPEYIWCVAFISAVFLHCNSQTSHQSSTLSKPVMYFSFWWNLTFYFSCFIFLYINVGFKKKFRSAYMEKYNFRVEVFTQFRMTDMLR